MILRKPYAFLIKYFRLIHTILLVMMCYLMYRTSMVLNFLQEYLNSERIVIGKDFTGELFSTWMFSLPFIIIVILGILLGVMFYKKKPKIYYLFNILVMVAVLVFYNIGYDTVGTLEAQILETRELRLIRDLFVIVVLFQGFSLILTSIRATGFDIKKFDFHRDFEQLDITEADAEEFEVDVNFETDLFRRDFRKNLRFAKYIYAENKFIIDGIILIVFSIACFIIYMNLTIYNKTYKEGDSFLASDFTMSVSESYLTNQNYKGVQITNNYLLIVKLDIMANYEKIKLNKTKATLNIKDELYYPINTYNSSLIDLGTTYNNTVINSEDFENILLVYEIPTDLIKEKMTFKYLDSIETSRNGLNPKYIKVKLTPYNLDTIVDETIVELNNDIELNEKLFGTTKINLTGFEISERFKLNYNYCNKNNCYESIEYLNPILNTNYDKALLRIDGEALLDENLNNKDIYNLYTIINRFGRIKYQNSRKINYYYPLTKINPKKASVNNSYYIEIPKYVMFADKISFIVDIRDKTYEYVIK